MAEITCYEFGPFRLDLVRQVLFRDGERVSLTPKAFDLLKVLILYRGQVVSKETLINQMWPGASTAENSLRVAIRAIRKALGESAEDHQYIVTAVGGYSFVADVRQVATEGENKESAIAREGDYFKTAPSSIHTLPNQTLHIHVASALYGALAGVMVLVEVAYEFDKYFRLALPLSLLAFFWAYFTSATGLRAAERFVEQGRRAGLVFVIGAFISAAVVLYLGVSWFLPPLPITRQTIGASTAQAAYLKAVVYHLLLALPFLVVTFYFTQALHRELRSGQYRPVLRLLAGSRRSVPPKGTIYLRVWALTLILAFYMAYAVLAHHSLVGTLEPDPFKNIFIILLWVRLAVFLGFSIECLIWYSWALNEMKRVCLLRMAPQ